LGARGSDIGKLVLRQGLTAALAGIAIGSAGAFGITRILASQLYGVSPHDPLTFLVVPLTLLALATAASYLPARRAARVDPVVALRHD
jgi:ABC-type antimicrobial peptide transport system permease subunit